MPPPHCRMPVAVGGMLGTRSLARQTDVSDPKRTRIVEAAAEMLLNALALEIDATHAMRTEVAQASELGGPSDEKGWASRK